LGSALRKIETGSVLDRVGEPLNAALQNLLRTGAVRDALSGKALGHPAHPALVSTPIGCWTGALVADAFGERRAGQLLTAAGVVSAVPVVATGLSDWADTTGAERRVGVVHLATNLAATAMYATSWWARARGRHGLGIAFGLGGAALATSAGWLGGHLAYGLGVGVDTNAFVAGPTEWTAVEEEANPLSAISSGRASGVGLVVIRADGDSRRTPAVPQVLANRCSHRGGPLAEGRLVGDCIQCPWHQSEFHVDTGFVHRGPATVPQPVYEVRAQANGVQVRREESRSLRLNSVRP
jgi:Rieske Fe-S protein